MSENCIVAVVVVLNVIDAAFLFCQDSAILPAVMELEESELSKELKEKAKASVEHFLQVKKRENWNLTRLVFMLYCSFSRNWSLIM